MPLLPHAAHLDPAILRRAALAFVAGATVGALYVMLELLTRGIIIRTAIGWIPNLSSPKHFKISHGVLAIRLSKLDQNVNLAIFHLWPGLLALMGLAGTRRVSIQVLFFLTIAATVALSEHDSSQVALLGSGLVVLLAWKWRAIVIRTLAVLWCAAFVLVLPANFAAFESGLHDADWLPKSARARVILWEFTSEQVLQRPLLGVGVDSTPRLNAERKATLTREKPEGFVFPRTMGHHSHSLYLQTWYELGAVGALLLAIAGAVVVMLIFLLPASAQPFAAGAFATFAIVGAFAWGMWQSWFMCAAALLPIYLRIAAVGASSDDRTSRSGGQLNDAGR